MNETDASPQSPAIQPDVSFGRALAYSIANFGYGAFYTLNNAILSLFLARFTKNNVIIGLGGSTHSFEGAIIQPLVGAASDRLRGKFGRRRPFLITAIPISALFLILTPLCAHLPEHTRLLMMVLCIFLFTVTFNIAQDPYNALMPDITPEHQRGSVTGISMFVFLLGQVSLLVLPSHLGPITITLEAKFLVCALLMLATTLVTVVCVKEPEVPAHTAGQIHINNFASTLTAMEGLLVLRQARCALAVSFFSGLGVGAVFPFLTVFIKTIGHCNDDVALQVFLILVAVTALFVVPFGKFVDRFGPRPVLLLALILIGTASALGLWVKSLDQIRLVMVIAGLGNSAQFAAAYPLLYQLVPRQEVGFYTGLQSTALSIATPITGVLTGMLVNSGDYRRIFVVCSLCVLVAIGFLVSVKVERAPGEVAERTRELEA